MTPFDAHVLRTLHDDRVRRLNRQLHHHTDPAGRTTKPARRRPRD